MVKLFYFLFCCSLVLYKTLIDFHFKLQISNQIKVQSDEARENITHSDSPIIKPSKKKREEKEETKGSIPIEDEMMDNFSDSIEYKEQTSKNNDTIPQELVLYQLRFDEFEERFRALETNLEEKSNQNKLMQEAIDDLNKNNEKCLGVIGKIIKEMHSLINHNQTIESVNELKNS